ncbi:response regulator transcription factor [Sphingobacterium corticibacterium]|uniref:Response regulator transcription factor n=1 Tax=Sphingobacterium corticibacterium TaxID=2484746 RepID=A0A4Q6XNN7_9SPHI|nr:response regulator transcription factor [Sphingobacterium corticibacterium]RZF58189.1 response regulator transcription factor [Sphingobacterium corticibacterium]
METNILILEDEIIIARSIKLHLETNGYAAEMATSPEEAMKLLEQQSFDLVLSDINLRHAIDGISFAKQFIPERTPVVFLTAYSDLQTLQKAELVMPYAYLLKPFHKEQLLLTINLSIAHARKKVLPSSIAINGNNEEITLSAREIEVVQLVAQGKTTTEIAHQLCISPETVATHRKKITRKTKCKNVVELIALAVDKGWL